MNPDNTTGSGADADRLLSGQAPGKGSEPTARGRDAALLAAGGIAPDPATDEQTPLLSRQQESVLGDSAQQQNRPVIPDDDDDEHHEGDPNEWPGLRDFEGLPWYRRPHVFFLFVPFLLFMLAFGGIFVPKVNLVQDLLCRDHYAKQGLSSPSAAYELVRASNDNDDLCTVPEVVAAVSYFTMASNLITGLLSAFTSPKLGALSDRYGRLPILILSSMGLLMSEALTICAATYPETFVVNWIQVGYVFDGLCGSFIVGVAMGNAYATDCTEPARRNVAFGYMYGCLYIGIALGPLIAATLLKYTPATILTLFWVALACHLFFITALVLVVPESLSKRRQIAARKRHAAQQARSTLSWFQQTKQLVTTMFEPLRVLYPTGPGSSPALRRNLVVFAAIDTTVFGVAMGALSVITLYMREQFHWDAAEQSLFVSTVNVARVVCLFIILPLVTRLIRGKPLAKQDGTAAAPQRGADTLDLYIVRVAVLLDTIGYVGYTLARSSSLFIISGVVAAVGGIASPTLTSSMTKHIPTQRTGQLLGANGLLHALARILAPIIFNSIFSATNGGFRQAVFACLAGTFSIAFVLTWILRPGVYQLDANATGGGEGQSQGDGEEAVVR